MTFSGHVGEEDLERYIMNRTMEPDLTRIEEHLLICEHCQDACESLQQEIDRIRDALRPE